MIKLKNNNRDAVRNRLSIRVGIVHRSQFKLDIAELHPALNSKKYD